MDDLDLKLLELLQADGRMTQLELSREVGLVFSDRLRAPSGAFVDAVRATYGAGRSDVSRRTKVVAK